MRSCAVPLAFLLMSAASSAEPESHSAPDQAVFELSIPDCIGANSTNRFKVEIRPVPHPASGHPFTVLLHDVRYSANPVTALPVVETLPPKEDGSRGRYVQETGNLPQGRVFRVSWPSEPVMWSSSALLLRKHSGTWELIEVYPCDSGGRGALTYGWDTESEYSVEPGSSSAIRVRTKKTSHTYSEYGIGDSGETLEP